MAIALLLNCKHYWLHLCLSDLVSFAVWIPYFTSFLFVFARRHIVFSKSEFKLFLSVQACCEHRMSFNSWQLLLFSSILSLTKFNMHKPLSTAAVNKMDFYWFEQNKSNHCYFLKECAHKICLSNWFLRQCRTMNFISKNVILFMTLCILQYCYIYIMYQAFFPLGSISLQSLQFS